jgi:nicotinamide-nucleotide amidase
MIVEIINIGSELLLGRVLNTHQQWLCRQLSDLGYTVSRQVAVADTADQIRQAASEALSRADLIICTGGLGPTSDDITRNVIADTLGKKLALNEAVLAQVEDFFKLRGRPVPTRTRSEALVPEGAVVLTNRHGTASGLAMKVERGLFSSGSPAAWMILLPGPPRELRPMFLDFVVPLLRNSFPISEAFVCRTLRTVGIGESIVQEKIEGEMQSLVDAGLGLGYCARPGQVDVRFTARGAAAEALINEAEKILRAQLSSHIFGLNDELLEEVVVRILIQRRLTLSVAESCTGGLIANRLTNVPGASAVFLGGFVSYSNEMKQSCARVRAESLTHHGAVSDVVAREMAEGTRQVTHSDYAISVTGIAGPDGGTPEKPVGTAFIGIATPGGTTVQRMFNPWDRQTFKEATSQQALNQLRVHLEQLR